MEQQQTKLPLEWLSSRRTPELHRLEQLCRETAREHRCAQRRLQEVEEAMASEREKSCPEALPAASGPTQREQLSRKLNAANAELRRYETRMFAYERTMLALRKENAELTARCEELRSELDKISTAPLRLDVPSALPTVPFPEPAAQTPPAAARHPKTTLDHLAAEVQLQDRKSALIIIIDHRFHSAGQFHQIFLLHTSPFSFHHLYL